jgi:hypothetical protein
MAGYLEEYGVEEARRGKLLKRIALSALVAIAVGLALYFFLRNFQERRVANRFLDDLKTKNYQAAYELWGCTATSPCRDYKFEKFLEDWGPKGLYAQASEGKFTIEDACGPGVVFTLEIPGTEPLGLYVNRADKVLGYAPWPRCPGRHWHLWEFLFGKKPES